MKYLITLTALLVGICQPTRTLAQAFDLGGSTYAVVIGISDYQDRDIPDLRFADRDAEAFANFLRSPAGGSLDGDHLKVLTNQQATAGRIAEALDGLIEQAKEDDQVIIYFSGHGDVEGKKISQPGFLLCWDSPSRVYMGGGTYSLSFLQEVVTTLSVQNKARVTVITDACHAGKLAGSQIGGAQLTSANLAKQYANEVKILSCQPGEFSLEGEQWGGGRGVFSYHLVDGLFGLADRNGDGTVSVGEIDRYLEDHVTAEAAPQSQVPMLMGNKTERLATVNAAVLADLQKHKAGGMPTFAATESRGFEDEVLAKVDTSIREMYRAFKLAVQEKRFFAPVGNSADEYFAQLTGVEALAPLRGIMRRNYAAALQDDAQQTLNEWLNPKQEKLTVTNERLTVKAFTEKVRSFPRCLDRAAELLGEKHYMYTALKARKYFFEGYLLTNYSRKPNTARGEEALLLFRQSLAWQPEQPHVFWQMSLVFSYLLQQPDSLEYYVQQAIEVNPNWVLPYTDAVTALVGPPFQRFSRARIYLEQATLIDSNSIEILLGWGMYYHNQNRMDEAKQQMKKALVQDSTCIGAWDILGWICYQTNQFDEAEVYLKKAIVLDSSYLDAWLILGLLYNDIRSYAEAEPVLMKAIALDSTDDVAWINLGDMYLETNRYDEAEPVYKKAIALDSTDAANWNNLGYLYIRTQRYAEAEPIFWRIVTADSTYLPGWNNLGNIYRETNRYDESEKMYRKAFALDAAFMPTYRNYASLKIKMGDLQSAFSYLEQAIQKGYDDYQGMQTGASLAPLREQKEQWQALMNKYFANQMYYNLACEQSLKGELDKAFESLEQSLTNGWKDYDWMQQDTDLAPLREQKEQWKELMKKHFPDQIKD